MISQRNRYYFLYGSGRQYVLSLRIDGQYLTAPRSCRCAGESGEGKR
jgi:hypothetical protein